MKNFFSALYDKATNFVDRNSVVLVMVCLMIEAFILGVVFGIMITTLKMQCPNCSAATELEETTGAVCLNEPPTEPTSFSDNTVADSIIITDTSTAQDIQTTEDIAVVIEPTISQTTQEIQVTEDITLETEPTIASSEKKHESSYESIITSSEKNMLAYLVDKEIGSGTINEKKAVVWCVLNRVDNGFRSTIYGVLTQPGQFHSNYGYGSSSSMQIVEEVVALWEEEKSSGYPVPGRVIPIDYCWYYGDGQHNHFRNSYKGGSEWNWVWTNGY